jgi:hypothetical protein
LLPPVNGTWLAYAFHTMTTTPLETQSSPLDTLAGKGPAAPAKREERDEDRDDAERWAELPCTD